MITNAVSSKIWPGEAKVHVSLINWIKEVADPPSSATLDGQPVVGITSALTAGTSRMDPQRLGSNEGRSFQGPIPVGMGFIVSADEAHELLDDLAADYSKIVRPYLMGDDVVNDPSQAPTRWIIDFGTRALEDAQAWPRALELVRERVRPERSRNRDRGFRERWWQFGRARGEMRNALAGLPRYVAANRVGKRLHFIWADPAWCPGDKVVVFRSDDDFIFGVLASSLHTAWAWVLSSTLKADLNYTPTSAFETFPFPEPNASGRARVSDAARAVHHRRSEICRARQIGLTRLYNDVDEGAYRDLRDLHSELDEAVAAAYGWPASAAHNVDESNRLLLELNRAIAAGEIEYRPFGRD